MQHNPLLVTTLNISSKNPLLNQTKKEIPKSKTLTCDLSKMGEQTQSPPKSPPVQNSSKIPLRPHKLRKLSSPPLYDKKSPPETDKKPRRKPLLSSLPPPLLKPLSAPGELPSALLHLRASDPLLAPLTHTLPPPALDSDSSPFLALTKSILYQQLAPKAGHTTYLKFVNLCGGEAAVVPDTVLALTAHSLRDVSVSARKSSYLFDLAHKYKSGILSDEKILAMDDKSLFTMLSMVKGIGSWSVHMFMIFSLHRPDVLPVSDVEVRKGVKVLYGLEELPRPSQMEELCEKWRPYRSVGAWYMWRLVEGKGGRHAGSGFEGVGSSVMPLQMALKQDGEGEEIDTRQQPVEDEDIEGGDVNFGDCIWEE